MRTAIKVLVSCSVITLAAGPVRAETTACTAITSLPTIISTSGIYCLQKEFSLNMVNGTAIQINASNVVLDLNSHRIGNLSAGNTNTATAIESTEKNLTIKNGTIRGFYDGLLLLTPGQQPDQVQGHVVEDLRLDRNIHIGISIYGHGSVVRNNQVIAMGPGPTDPVGIADLGDDNRIINNDVVKVTAAPGTISFGIFVLGGNTLVVNNRITDADLGVYFYYGVGFGKYRDNLTTAVSTPYFGGIDAGNNN